MSKYNIIVILLLAGLMQAPVKAQDEELIGLGNDGNRSGPVHLIELYDETGKKIDADDKNPKPFSLKQTCSKCHDYETIASGWHFNGHHSEVEKGRPSQPWILRDSKTRTQIPISGRHWEGTFTPEQLGITPWEFVKQNFSHFPGGSYGEIPAEEPDEVIRQEISGMYEINCLACHNASPNQDQSEAALQSARQNYRWIPAASSGMGDVKGVASSLDDFFDPEFDEGVKVTYRDELFNSEDKVLFDIAGQPANERCYFCHSNQNLSVGEDQEWTRDEDVHLHAGLNCVDCHRNGDDHMITRGADTEGQGQTLTCEGCHLGDKDEATPESGRLGAPEPKHKGIPTIHFEKLTCTACHSGTWPDEETGRWRTARIHQTGLHGKHNLNLQTPHVYAPVMMKGEDGKIGPYKIMWPSYWAVIADEKIAPLPPDRVLEKAGDVLGETAEWIDDWRPLTEDQIAQTLQALAPEEGTAVYIAGGELYQLDTDGKLIVSKDDLAKPYAWPMAHDVRPAEQAMGIRKCVDCHTTDSAFFFGKVEMDSPVKTEAGPAFAEMIQLQGINRLYMYLFNFSFVFRPILKIVALASCGLIAIVLLVYVIRAVGAISKACAQEGV